MRLGQTNKSKSQYYGLLIGLIIITGSIVILREIDYVDQPELYQAGSNKQEIIVSVVKVTFFDNETSWDLDFNSLFGNRLKAFYRTSSRDRLTFDFANDFDYLTNETESYYGENSQDEVISDVNIDGLVDELTQFVVQGRLTIAIHNGIAQNLNTGNSSGLIDQYFGRQTGYVDGLIIISQASPYGVLVHEIGHFLGLPDLYGAGGINDYGLMGTGSWHSYNPESNQHGYAGTHPTDLSTWSKMQLDWVDYWNTTNTRKTVTDLFIPVIRDTLILQWKSNPLDIRDDLWGLVAYWDRGRTIEMIGNIEHGDTIELPRTDEKIRITFDEEKQKLTIQKVLNFELSTSSIFEIIGGIMIAFVLIFIFFNIGKFLRKN